MTKYSTTIVPPPTRSIILTALEEQVLLILAKSPKPLYSVDVVRLLGQLSQGQIVLSSGTITPMLKRVLKEGWIVAHSSTKTNGQLSVRKTYTITATGQAALASTEELRRRINNWV